MNNGQKSWAHVRLAMNEAVRNWIYDPNVTLIDYGWRIREHKLEEDEFAIRVHVIHKYKSDAALETAIDNGITHERLPDKIAGIPVDVPRGVYRLNQWFFRRKRPRPANPRAKRNASLQGGISIANARLKSYGTLGGLVIDRRTGERMILSNWHVLAGYWDIQPGWPIYQPGRGDGGSRDDTVAKFSRHAMASNLDAAVAEVTGDRRLANDQFGLAPVRGVSWAQPGMAVVKSGRRTGVTYGRITGVEGTARMNYRGINRLIHNVMTIEPRRGLEVSAGGDSGSFWLEEDSMNVVGLHFAGGNHPERALAIYMQPILDALDVDMAVA